MILSLIVGIGKGRQIGKNNQMLWHVKEDFQHFKKTTMGHCMLMGRKTYESIGRPLPGRTTLILTRDPNFQIDHKDVFIFNSSEAALSFAKEKGESELFICGGGDIYSQYLPVCERLYLSRIDFDGEADAFFPEFEHFEWSSLKKETFPGWSFELLSKS